MINSDQIYSRLLRPAALVGGVLAYVFFTWSLLETGRLQATTESYFQLVIFWVAGFAAIIFAPMRKISPATAVLLRVLWCCLGTTAVATLIPDVLRVLLLMLPVYGILYAALKLNERYVVAIATISWGFYVMLMLVKSSVMPLDSQFEVLMALAFAAFLGGGVLVSFEMLTNKSYLVARNEALRETLERMQELALKDELTGTNNRRSILNILRRQKALADRGQTSFTLCYCDLDHFKKVNDRYGHVVGDEVLRRFAKLAASVVRNVDYVARLGGEEFVLLLVDTDREMASQVAQRLCAHTRDLTVPGFDSDFKLTVSVGITEYRGEEGVDDLLGRADTALYRAKQSGRDRVVLAP